MEPKEVNHEVALTSTRDGNCVIIVMWHIRLIVVVSIFMEFIFPYPITILQLVPRKATPSVSVDSRQARGAVGVPVCRNPCQLAVRMRKVCWSALLV